MGALYHLKQKLVDFCNVIQENVSRTDTVPSSKVVYDLKADSDSQISDLNDSLANLRIPTDIPANSNLNNITALGIYSCGSTSSATSVTNNPCGNAFYLEVVSVSLGAGGAWIGRLQILTEYRGSAVYIRRASTDGSGSWSFTGWYKYTGTAA